MERHGHLQLNPVVRSRLLDVSAATIDRLLRPEREATRRLRCRRWGMGSAVRQAYRYEPSLTGTIRRQVISSATWWNTAVE